MIHQSVLHLPFFDEDVPVLYAEDGKAYVPVIALCDMLGLRADTHIPRWRKLVLWTHAQKLPFQTVTGRTQKAWCLHVGAIPLWCACFDWSLVPPQRQEPLRLATDSWSETLQQVHQTMLHRYRQLRSLLFHFLITYEHIDTRLSRLATHLHPILGQIELCMQLDELVAQGKTVIRPAVDHARRMIHEQAKNPVVDAFKVNKDGQILEEFSLPLFPIFSQEDGRKFFEYREQIEQWGIQLVAFLEQHGILSKGD